MTDALPRDSHHPLVTTLRFFADPEGTLDRCAREQGDPFHLKLLGVGDMIVTSTPEHLRELFSARPELFTPPWTDNLAPLLGGHSLLLLAGEAHRRERRLMMPSFHGDRMRAYGAVIQQITHRALAARRPGPLVALTLSQEIALEVIIQCVFGVTEPDAVARCRAAVSAFVDAYTPALVLFPGLRRGLFGDRGPWARFVRNRAAFEALLLDEVARRRARHEPGREDILSLLLDARDEDGEGLTDQELADELRTLLIGGYETTANTLAWAMDLAVRDPEVRRRVLAEIDALGATPEPAALAQLPYLGAVCQETIRMRPVLSVVGRQTVAPFTFAGREVPIGTVLGAAIFHLHHRPALYPDPERFDPERFLQRKFGPFEFIGFGGGARRCMGAAFATYLLRVSLGTMLAGFHWRCASPEPLAIVRRGVGFGPARGGPLVLQGLRG
ncbi:MAG: cytochrome P450 [Nannocystaceae bacterium]